MKIILLGAPGAGKSTVAKLLTEYDGSHQISTGDILRAAVVQDSLLGKKAKAYMDKGDLVPDSLIMAIMETRLREPDCQRGFILDGFPRTIPQAREFNKLLASLKITMDFVANLDVPQDVVLERLTTRRICSNPSCQEIYNIKSNPPAPGNKCKKCNSDVIQRADETKEVITKRLSSYLEKTAPLITFYEKEGLLRNFLSLNANDTFGAIKNALNGK